MLDMKKLAAIITDREGLKFQLPIAQVSEVLAYVSEEMAKSTMVIEILLRNGRRRIEAQDKSLAKQRKRAKKLKG